MFQGESSAVCGPLERSRRILFLRPRYILFHPEKRFPSTSRRSSCRLIQMCGGNTLTRLGLSLNTAPQITEIPTGAGVREIIFSRAMFVLPKDLNQAGSQSGGRKIDGS